MPIRDGQRAVKNLVEDNGRRAARTPAELSPLLPEVQRRAKEFYECYESCRDNKGDHCLAYDGRNHEIEMWHLGLMFLEYVAGLFLDKAEKGHCYAENRSNPVCSFSRDMHLRMVAVLKDDLCKLVDEITLLETTEKPKWAKAEPHPKPP